MIRKALLFVEKNETWKKELQIAKSVETVRKRLGQSNLNACSPRKVPLLTVKHVAKQFEYDKIHKDGPVEKWRNIFWSDESKIVLLGGKGSRSYVRRPPRTEYNPRYTFKKFKNCLKGWAFCC